MIKPMEPWERALPLSHDTGEADFKQLGEVIHMTEW